MSTLLRRLLLTAALTSSIALTAGAALAQDSAAPPQGPPPQARESPADRAAEYATHLRDTLHLRADQQPALDAYLDALRPHRGMHEHQRREGGEDAGLTTPERLDRMLARLDERRERMVAVVDATKRFYDQLAPDQRQAFDAMGPMTGFGRHGGHGMGPRDHDGDDHHGGPEGATNG
jgi:protein CpxP